MKKLIVGNFKMNTTLKEFSLYLDRFLPKIKDSKNSIVMCVPYTHLMLANQKLVATDVKFGSQNLSVDESGAHTGEISNHMIKDIGASYTLVGHSEIRKRFKETNEQVNQKIINALGVNLKAILCVGETKTERNAGKTDFVLKKQIDIALKGLYENELKNIIIAYEPCWAIGTGKTATSKDIENAVKIIRKTIAESFSDKAAEKIQILYGGSTKLENFNNILKIQGINGLLVGGACLDYDVFAKMCK